MVASTRVVPERVRGPGHQDDLVGSVVVHDSLRGPGYMLWRLLIDERFQGRGYGRAAVRLVLDHVRTRPGATRLLVGVHRGEGSPLSFYEFPGSGRTGQVIEDDEDVLSFDLTSWSTMSLSNGPPAQGATVRRSTPPAADNSEEMSRRAGGDRSSTDRG